MRWSRYLDGVLAGGKIRTAGYEVEGNIDGQSILRLRQIVVHVNGNEMAWANENIVTIGDETHSMISIETFSWEPNGDLTIKTYYDMPESVGEDDDPYEHFLGADNVIPNA